jgi:hypothetical protein
VPKKLVQAKLYFGGGQGRQSGVQQPLTLLFMIDRCRAIQNDMSIIRDGALTIQEDFFLLARDPHNRIYKSNRRYDADRKLREPTRSRE